MTALKVFITGATGYIGGEVLYQILNLNYNFDITALVRNQAKSEKLLKSTNNKVKTAIGDLDDLQLIEKYAQESDIIINTADVDHVPSAEVLYKALTSKKTPTYLIHTSGTSILGDSLREGKRPSKKVYSDVKNIEEINSLPLEQPHRPVDKIILDISEKNPIVYTVVVSPSNIFGQSNGYDKIISAQIPLLASLSVKNSQAFSVFDGNYIWSRVHIKDLGDLYLLLLDKLLKGENISKGKQGYYFGSYTVENEVNVSEEPVDIEIVWRKVSEKVGQELYKKKLISKEEVAELKPEQIVKIPGSIDFAPYLWGTNSRSRGDNGIRVGWKPKYTGSKTYWDSIEEDVDYMEKNGLLK